MARKHISIFLTVILFTLIITWCSNDTNAASASDMVLDEQSYDDVTDLQLALLNSIMFNDSLTELEGKSIEGHEELIKNDYKKYIPGGESLVNELKGYTLIDYDYGDVTGFKASAFTKGNNLVIAYCGTDHWTDFVDDAFAGVFDFSAMDGQAKAFAKDNVNSHKHFNVYITGYSMGGRLCYLGAEELFDNIMAGNLKRVCTFNGLGVKEAMDFTDGNLSNIHNLEFKYGDKAYNYIVKGDFVSDGDSQSSFKYRLGYNHIGAEFKVPCTNEIDTAIMKQHDLYSIIDFLLNGSQSVEDSGKNMISSAPLIGGKDAVSFSFDFSASGNSQVGILTAFDEKGNIQWTYETQAVNTELNNIRDIGLISSGYLLQSSTEGVVCLDKATGDVKWKNDYTYGGIFTCIDGNENIYIIGYYHPVLRKIDRNGMTIAELDFSTAGYGWGHNIMLTGENELQVSFDISNGEMVTSDVIVECDTFNFIGQSSSAAEVLSGEEYWDDQAIKGRYRVYRTDYLTVRKETNINSEELGKLYSGDVVTAIMDDDRHYGLFNGFAKIIYNGGIGYVLPSYLEHVDGEYFMTGPESNWTGHNETIYGWPSDTAEVLGELGNDAFFMYGYNSEGGFFLIGTQYGFGYIKDFGDGRYSMH